MRKYRNISFYTIVTAVLLFVIYMIIRAGNLLENSKPCPVAADYGKSKAGIFSPHISGNNSTPLSILLLQIISIIFTSRLLGSLFKKLGQPVVVGEVAAGIVLGPSVLGLLFPAVSQFIFPQNSLGTLQLFSQLGLILFMFVVGMELNLNSLKHKAGNAIIISHASIIIPYTLGVALAYFLYRGYATAGTKFLSFSLFIGIAMSITAFPVLARIMKERKMNATPIGNLAITCAATDDITAWCLLAMVISIAKAGSTWNAVYTIALVVLYVLIMLKVIKPLLSKISNSYFNIETLTINMLAVMIIVLLVSSYFTELIGIHALFGAFLAGVIMPSAIHLRNQLIERTEYISVTLLLPLFFAFSGLRTQIGLLNNMHTGLICIAILIVAIAGKFGGSLLAAKFVGESWKDSMIIGILINTRGLMELVVLNLGYDLGIISSEIFTMMVIMALVTTCMTGPVLNLVTKKQKH
ncbi:MAG TPA: cation:proton antiporter [Puia sp.]|nr:cation:proton antiporter [Puia sp.]